MSGSQPMPTDPRFQDLTGQKFASLRVDSYHGRTSSHGQLWNCICECGGKCRVVGGNLKNGNSTTCKRCLSQPKSDHHDEWLRFYLLESMRIVESGCWEWQGYLNDKGYGRIKLRGKSMGTHVASYLAFNGNIDNGEWVLHSCDNPPCCNPLHLFLGDAKANAEDRDAKGHGAKGESHPNSKLKHSEVSEIRSMYATGEFSQVVLAEKFKMSQSEISYIVSGEHWK